MRPTKVKAIADVDINLCKLDRCARIPKILIRLLSIFYVIETCAFTPKLTPDRIRSCSNLMYYHYSTSYATGADGICSSGAAGGVSSASSIIMMAGLVGAAGWPKRARISIRRSMESATHNKSKSMCSLFFINRNLSIHFFLGGLAGFVDLPKVCIGEPSRSFTCDRHTEEVRKTYVLCMGGNQHPSGSLPYTAQAPA